jgi:hypothetical protein
MKLFIKKIINSDQLIKVRNFINYKPVHMSISKIKKTSSVSDAFCWRTDNGFTTSFNYSDILNLFYKIKNSYVDIYFYTKKNILIKKLTLTNLKYSNKILINKKLLNGTEDYGSFYIYHVYNKKIQNNFIISNRCYLGFSKDNSLSSFVHGNTLAKYQNIDGGKKNSDIIKISPFINQNYRIQNYFRNFDKTEIFYNNPTSKVIKFSIDNRHYVLKPGHSTMINIYKQKNITTKSNCLFFRPLIFNYKNNYLDVYHG